MVEIIFLMLVLKLPILYLIGVIYWAIKAEPPPPEPAVLPVPVEGEPPVSPRPPRPRRPRRGGPHDRSAERRPARAPVR